MFNIFKICTSRKICPRCDLRFEDVAETIMEVEGKRFRVVFSLPRGWRAVESNFGVLIEEIKNEN